jgi:hypothetical protein
MGLLCPCLQALSRTMANSIDKGPPPPWSVAFPMSASTAAKARECSMALCTCLEDLISPRLQPRRRLHAAVTNGNHARQKDVVEGMGPGFSPPPPHPPPPHTHTHSLKTHYKK